MFWDKFFLSNLQKKAKSSSHPETDRKVPKQPASSKSSNKKKSESKAATTSPDHHHSQHRQHSQKAASDKENNDLLDKAATKIQSTFRGYKTRKNLNVNLRTRKTRSHEHLANQDASGSAESSRVASESKQKVKKRSHTSGSLDKTKRKTLITDPEVAAVKIQSTYRGYMTRKQLDNMKQRDAQN